MTNKEIAEAIVRELFTNGNSETAERLVLTVDGPPMRTLGGWSQRGAAWQIQGTLDRLKAGEARRDE